MVGATGIESRRGLLKINTQHQVKRDPKAFNDQLDLTQAQEAMTRLPKRKSTRRGRSMYDFSIDTTKLLQVDKVCTLVLFVVWLDGSDCREIYLAPMAGWMDVHPD